MQLHELPKTRSRRTQRVGRGGKRGTYTGRGTKGQKSRSGRKMRPAERDLILRIPKQRGFQNKPKSPITRVFNLGGLGKILSHIKSGGGVVINREMLVSAGLLPATYRGRIKILGDGEMRTPATFEGFEVSQGAKAKIEKAGGKVIT